MPVDTSSTHGELLLQRDQYSKGGLSRRYWDYKDEQVISAIGDARRILDVGCGEGILLEKLIRHFPESDILGVDIFKLNIDICEKHGLPAALGGAYGLPFADESFDAAVFMEVVEHLDDPLRAIRELHRILKRGGRLLVLFPNDFTFKMARIMMLMFKEAFYDPGHLRQWTPAAMKKALEQNGFRVTAQKSLPLPLFALSLHHLVVAEKI